MVISFSINFYTYFGQDLYITGSIPELGGGNPDKAVAMNFRNDGIWEKEIKITSLEERVFSYRYFVRNPDGSTINEVGCERRIALTSSAKNLFLNDEWQGNTNKATFLTAPFSEIFFSNGHGEATQTGQFPKELVIRVTIPAIEEGCSVYLCGDHPLTGSWDPHRAAEMTPVHGSRWEIHLPAEKIGRTLRFKFVKACPANGTFQWEDRPDRTLEVPSISKGCSYIKEYSDAAFGTGNPKLYGTAVPVFSLRTENSCGIGDFSDLRIFGDWIEKTGQNIIQILPVNDTTSTGTWTDSYPYGAITVMALHPIFINIEEIGAITDKEAKKAYDKRRKALNRLPQIDYEAVLELKTEYLKIQYGSYAEDTFSEPEYYRFFKNNSDWLLPYCAFCVLRDKYGTADFSKWGDDSRFSFSRIETFMSKTSPYHDGMMLGIFTQYHLHKQLSASVAYLHGKHIALKGDIPIGITPNSVDAWTDTKYFNMGCQAGAPPDDFSADGQNWGFPTYNWDTIAADRYEWWKKRFRKMAEYFDAYRIDHVLGFFRIWEIPSTQVKGLMGHFSPALPMPYEEIAGYGFNFDYHRHATPYIRYYQIREMFGDRTEEVMEKYLDSKEFEVFTLKKEFDTQKKIEAHFKGKDKDLMEGLMALAGEVLFIEDELLKGKFHPRISAQFTYSYKALPEEDKAAFNRLYDHFFYHRHNEFWKDSAFRKLPEIISSTNMLTCAEDLGMIPACVPEVINALHILSLEIFRMPKDPKQEFGNPAAYPYLSVCTTGTHDTSTLRSWWEEDRKASAAFYHNVLHESGNPPYYCEPWLCEKIIAAHTSGASMLVILPLQDWMSIDGNLRAENPHEERINVPSNPKHYWRYRMHLTVEQLLKEDNFNGKIKKLTGR